MVTAAIFLRMRGYLMFLQDYIYLGSFFVWRGKHHSDKDQHAHLGL